MWYKKGLAAIVSRKPQKLRTGWTICGSIGMRSSIWYSICRHPRGSIPNAMHSYVRIFMTHGVSARASVTHYYTTITTSATALGNKNRKYVSLAPYVVCKDTSHFEELYQDIIDQGGEGVILRDPLSPYQSGRSTGYLKHKVRKQEKLQLILTIFYRNTETRRRG